MKIGIVGMGKMGEALAKGLRDRDAKKYQIIGSTRTQASADESAKHLSIRVHTDNAKIAADSDVVILCVKPHQAEKVLKEMSPQLTREHLLITICAAVTSEQAHTWGGGKAAAIRAMPNTPALIGEGMTVLCAGPNVQPAQLETAEQLFRAVGLTAIVEESLMDGVTGLSGCGPAYIYLIIESLSEAGVKVGLPRETATLLATQTLLGSAKMVLQRGVHPAALKDEVTTPAGCTIDGLMALEEGKLRVTLIKAVLAATKRSKSLRGV